MSHSFLRFIKIFGSSNKIKFEPILFLLTVPHLGYVLSTQKEDNIAIINKYKYVSNGFTNFMIVDTNGKHYNVNNSFWFWKWDSIEDWHKLKVGDTIYAKCYGIRMPFLGCFPNIVDTNYIVKEKSKIEDEHHLISIDPVLTTNNDINYNNDNNDNNRIPREVIICALATFK
jgi:hypothetical protein